MSAPQRPWPTIDPLRRWGPMALVLVAFVALAAVATTRSPSGTASESTATSTTLAYAEHPDLPIIWPEAEAEGTTDDHTWGNCDPETGKIRYPSVYAPPCVPDSEGVNAGATHQGVTESTIKVVYYTAPDGDLSSAIAGNLDPDDAVESSVRAYLELFESIFETYGRTVELIPLTGSGVGTDETAARADAVQVATQIGAFASIGGPSQTPVYASELAERGVLCINCGLSLPNSIYAENAPYMWGNLTTAEQFLENVGVLLTQQLNGKPAKWAGDEALRSRERVFGVIRYSQDPPVYTGVSKMFTDLGKEQGWESEVSISYLLDLPKLPETAAAAIARLKSAGVTTVVFLGDPIMPIYLTQAATEQNYHPEWIVTGTVLTDTTALARNYDQDQWSRAFGVSTLPVRTPHDDADAYRIYEWYYGEMPAANKTAATFYPNLLQLYQGIHMAGGNLTPETFAGGMFRLPPAGGQPGAPQNSYGNPDLFNWAPADYTSVDDSTLIWWDADAEGIDEQGTEGQGMYRYVDGGKRYLPGQLPTELSAFFEPEGSITAFDGQPDELRTPDYDPPPGAPAAK